MTAGVAAATGGAGRERAPRQALGPARFAALPAAGQVKCSRAQARSPHVILCPRTLPRPWLGWPPGTAPPRRLRSEIFREGKVPFGIEFAYGAPVEPGAGSPEWVRRHLWLNRPCCAVHFVVFWLARGLPPVPASAIPTRLGGKRGRLLDALGYAPTAPPRDRNRVFLWANHTWFFWRQRGVTYAASLHYFGRRPTRTVLARLIRELRPVTK